MNKIQRTIAIPGTTGKSGRKNKLEGIRIEDMQVGDSVRIKKLNKGVDSEAVQPQVTSLKKSLTNLLQEKSLNIECLISFRQSKGGKISEIRLWRVK